MRSRLSDAMRHWLLGVLLLISGSTTFILYVRLQNIFWIFFGIWLVFLGTWSIYLSVIIKHHPIQTFEEQLNEVLDKPLPKRWRN